MSLNERLGAAERSSPENVIEHGHDQQWLCRHDNVIGKGEDFATVFEASQFWNRLKINR